jgi:uncharacterized protein (TIGR00251 family)
MERRFTQNTGKIHLAVKVIPGSAKNQVCEVKENRLRIKIASAAEEGKANEELHSFLAKQLGCAKKDILIITGEKSRLKTLALPSDVSEKLIYDGAVCLSPYRM